jgi:hypothetical protein
MSARTPLPAWPHDATDRVHELMGLVATKAREIGLLRDVLRDLRQVCLAMDAVRDADRPTETAYQRAMRRAAHVLGEQP